MAQKKNRLWVTKRDEEFHMQSYQWILRSSSLRAPEEEGINSDIYPPGMSHREIREVYGNEHPWYDLATAVSSVTFLPQDFYARGVKLQLDPNQGITRSEGKIFRSVIRRLEKEAKDATHLREEVFSAWKTFSDVLEKLR